MYLILSEECTWCNDAVYDIDLTRSNWSKDVLIYLRYTEKTNTPLNHI